SASPSCRAAARRAPAGQQACSLPSRVLPPCPSINLIERAREDRVRTAPGRASGRWPGRRFAVRPRRRRVPGALDHELLLSDRDVLEDALGGLLEVRAPRLLELHPVTDRPVEESAVDDAPDDEERGMVRRKLEAHVEQISLRERLGLDDEPA